MSKTWWLLPDSILRNIFPLSDNWFFISRRTDKSSSICSSTFDENTKSNLSSIVDKSLHIAKPLLSKCSLLASSISKQRGFILNLSLNITDNVPIPAPKSTTVFDSDAYSIAILTMNEL